MSFVSRAIGATKLFLKANGPTIAVGTGVASMGIGAVVASYKTLKIDEVLDPHVTKLDQIEKGPQMGLPSYTEETARQDRLKVYIQAGVDLTKLYAVPAVLVVGGGVLVFAGHRIMIKRQAALALAFTGLKKSFDAYRGRVVENFGTEADQAMMNGHIRKEVIDPETGVVETINVRDWEQSRQDPYNRVFEQGASTQWKPSLGANKHFLSVQRQFAQERLTLNGHLYLSDVYESLGFPETDISRVVGWKVKRNPDGTKEIPRVDFGLDSPHPDDWKYNQENAVYLDFNCTGLIIGGDIQKLLEGKKVKA